MNDLETLSMQPKEIGIGLLGYGFAAKAYVNALKTIPHMIWPPPAVPKLVSICGTQEGPLRTAAKRYGFKRYTASWKELVTDPEVELFINAGPNNLHAEPCLAAVKVGKHVLCEKPLARSADEAKQMWEAVKEAPIRNFCGFNYRFVPAIRLAKEMIDSKVLGRIYQFRAQYLQDWAMDAPYGWRFDREIAGSGVVGDIGAHIVDLARFLIGEIESVTATTSTFIKERWGAECSERRKVNIDDGFAAVVQFDNGVIGVFEASWVCAGHKNYLAFEVSGEKGSIAFNLEDLNVLNVYQISDEKGMQGFRRVLVTEKEHPFCNVWWSSGHVLGWEHAHVHLIWHVLEAIAKSKDIKPYGATFEDGYKCAVICDAILHSASEKTWIKIQY